MSVSDSNLKGIRRRISTLRVLPSRQMPLAVITSRNFIKKFAWSSLVGLFTQVLSSWVGASCNPCQIRCIRGADSGTRSG